MIDEDVKFYNNMLSKTKENKELIEEIFRFLLCFRMHSIKELNPDTQSIIRFGKGSGFNSTTYNLSLDENNRAK